MRQYKYYILLLVLFLGGKVIAQVNPNEEKDWGYLNKYKLANNALKNTKCEVLFMGNSITENWYKFDSAFFLTNHFINRGISGQTTSQFLVRFRQDVINLHPKILVLNGGSNDIAENTGTYVEEATLNNIITMTELAKFHGIKVLLSSTLPAGGFNWNLKVKDVPQKIKALNEKIKAYAVANNIDFIDYFPLMASQNQMDMQPAYSIDGVHPNLEGYKTMENAVLSAIAKAQK